MVTVSGQIKYSPYLQRFAVLNNQLRGAFDADDEPQKRAIFRRLKELHSVNLGGFAAWVRDEVDRTDRDGSVSTGPAIIRALGQRGEASIYLLTESELPTGRKLAAFDEWLEEEVRVTDEEQQPLASREQQLAIQKIRRDLHIVARELLTDSVMITEILLGDESEDTKLELIVEKDEIENMYKLVQASIRNLHRFPEYIDEFQYHLAEVLPETMPTSVTDHLTGEVFSQGEFDQARPMQIKYTEEFADLLLKVGTSVLEEGN